MELENSISRLKRLSNYLHPQNFSNAFYVHQWEVLMLMFVCLCVRTVRVFGLRFTVDRGESVTHFSISALFWRATLQVVVYRKRRHRERVYV